MWRENCFDCLRACRTEYNKVAWGGQTSTTSYNILENKRNVVSYNICLVKKFDSNQTLCNKIQHDTTRYNKVAKRVQHFIEHQSCMMLYEMLYAFDWGLRPRSNDPNFSYSNVQHFCEEKVCTVRPPCCMLLYHVA